MTVGELIEKLRDYPRSVEVVLARVFDGEVDGKVYELDKVRMKEITEGDIPRVATDDDFDADVDTTTVVVLFPEA